VKCCEKIKKHEIISVHTDLENILLKKRNKTCYHFKMILGACSEDNVDIMMENPSFYLLLLLALVLSQLSNKSLTGVVVGLCKGYLH